MPTISDIDEAADVLSADLRSVWRLVAGLLPRHEHRLVGGTAVAVHLAHRVSFDLDFLALRPFDAHMVAARLASIPGSEVIGVSGDWVDVRVWATNVQVFRQGMGASGAAPRWIEPGQIVSGIEVASIPDLLATKLDVILRRAASRDYYDLASIDLSTAYRLERGLEFHQRRYASTAARLEQIIDNLETPGTLASDQEQALDMGPVLDHLKSRVPALREAASHLRMVAPSGRRAASFPQTGRKAPKPLPQRKAVKPAYCHAWMPVSKKRCVLPAGHRGPHRSSR